MRYSARASSSMATACATTTTGCWRRCRSPVRPAKPTSAAGRASTAATSSRYWTSSNGAAWSSAPPIRTTGDATSSPSPAPAPSASMPWTTSSPASRRSCSHRWHRPIASSSPSSCARSSTADRGSTAGVLLVADVLAPGHRTARLVVLLHGDVHHEAVGRGAVPVVLAGLEEHAVAGPDLLDRAALALAEPDAFGDEDRLSVRVGVPGGARAGREVHECCGEGRAAGGCGDGVDVHIAGEPVGRALHGVDGAAGDLHGLHPLLAAGGWMPVRVAGVHLRRSGRRRRPWRARR